MANFRLIRESDNSLWLIVCDESGNPRFYVLGIQSDGTLYRCQNLGTSDGLQLDEHGRIIESSRGI